MQEWTELNEGIERQGEDNVSRPWSNGHKWQVRVGLKPYQGKHQLRLVLQCVILRPFHVQQKLYNVGCSKADAVSMRGLSMQRLSDQAVLYVSQRPRTLPVCVSLNSAFGRQTRCGRIEPFPSFVHLSIHPEVHLL